MKIVAITQARSGSTRLPGKVMMQIGGETLLGLHIRRILKSKMINRVIVATTIDREDEAIVTLCSNYPVGIYRGSVDDVLDRFYQACKQYGEEPDYVVRLTSDCPLIDPVLIDNVIRHAVDNRLDYCSNTLDPSYPDGQDVEVFTYRALERAWQEAELKSEREHVTPFIWKNSSFKSGKLFTSANFSEGMSYGHLRMTVDEQRDFDMIEKLIAEKGKDLSWHDYATYLDSNESVKTINETITRNEGYTKSINKDNP